MATQTLPDDFLSSSSANMTAAKIDFTQANLPEYAGRYACIIENALTADECQQLLHAAEATTDGVWERAMVNTGGGEQKLMLLARNCGRIIWDSRDIAGRVWQRIAHLPEVQEILRLEKRATVTGIGPPKRGEVWKLTRPNERMRFLKYGRGEYFRPHCDGMYITPDGKERCFFTLHLYLSDSGKPNEEALEGLSAEGSKAAVRGATIGGATTFHGMDMERQLDVDSKTGRVLLFQQRDLLHSGDDVLQGLKYTMRTDLMYELESEATEAVPTSYRR
ncbi:hypothetical protein K431DRAFT_286186 [Polychaeton citri CBS 116435]|uniref:Prolyl 4-hydroxylase alpha subunit domain-containing protein n=1 Tax=Polychaeton citri CBS 116435 TaxID=1314669 RepID=A0A9P4Q3R0_9PEZI|nr:hypothetical protein K431DRAFT_286186 [Polychaeton citri CBS 116435]